MRIRWLVLALGALVLLVAAPSEARPLAHKVAGDCGTDDTSVQGVAFDAQNIYYGGFDGRVTAVSRANGNVVWTYPGEHRYTPDAPVLDVKVDADHVYVAVSEVTNGVADPVLKLDKTTGVEVQRMFDFLDPRDDPFRVTVDGPFLYVGFNNGAIGKYWKDTLRLVQDDGAPVAFRPTLHAQTEDPNGIYAMAIQGDALWAARNFGNGSADRPVSFFHANNSIIILNKNSLQPFTGSGETRLRDGEGNTLQDAVFAIWPDAATQRLYLAGSRPMGQDATPVGTFYRAAIATDALTVDVRRHVGEGGLGLGQNERDAPAVPAATGIAGDGQGNLWGTTTINPATASGYLVKLDKETLQIAPGWHAFHGFDNNDILGLAVEDGADGSLFLGHRCQDLGDGSPGGLVVEHPKAYGPVVVLVSPDGNEITDGRIDINVRTHYGPTNTDPVALDLEFGLSKVGGDCVTYRDAGCYLPFEQIGIDLGDTRVLANRAARWDDVRIDVPEGTTYRLIVTARAVDVPSRTFTDVGETAFMVDRTAPVVVDVDPPHTAIVTHPSPTIQVTYRDEPATIDTRATRLFVNGQQVDRASMAFNSNGFSFEIADAPKYRLVEGFNALEAQVVDLAGNRKDVQWEVRLDTNVRPPVYSPANNGWVRDARPLISAQFFEEIDPASVVATFGPVDVSDKASILEPEGVLGTRIVFRPDAPLATGVMHRFSVSVRDIAGNAAGPFSTAFFVDDAAPQVSGIRPAPGSLLTDDRPAVRFRVADSASGADMRSLAVFVDGEDVSLDVDVQRDLAEYVPISPLRDGPHEVIATVMDVAGNLHVERWSFTVDLLSPQVTLEVTLPPGQTAAKNGDEVLLSVRVDDQSAIRGVQVDARALDGARSAQSAAQPVAGQPGLYEMRIDVTETRTRLAELFVKVEDMAGHVGVSGGSVLVDNHAPVTQMKPLPDFVASTFLLEWTNEPKDEAVGGSGISHYRLEQKVGEGQWSVVRPRLEQTRLLMEVSEGAFTQLSYRVVAVDNAGNEQLVPSNSASTVTRGDPFLSVDYPKPAVRGMANAFVAVPAGDLPITDSVVKLVLTGPGNVTHEVDLERFGRSYLATSNLTAAQPGDYVMRLHFRDSQGFEMIGRSFLLTVEGARVGLDGAAGGKDASWPAAIGIVALVAAVRRWRR